MEPFLKIASICPTLLGLYFIWASIKQAGNNRSEAAEHLKPQWASLTGLLFIFCAGWLLFAVLLPSRLSFSFELPAAVLFLGFSFILFRVLKLSQRSLVVDRTGNNDLNELEALNRSLETRLTDQDRELKKSCSLTKTILDNLQDSIALIDVESHKITAANKAFLRETGLTFDEVQGKTCYQVTHHRTSPCEKPHDDCPMEITLKTGQPAVTEHLHRTGNSTTVHTEVHTIPILESDNSIKQVVHISRNITERKNQEERIRSLAYYDELTGLPNRSFFREILTRAISHSTRYDKNLAILCIDLDTFKRINDTLGHSAGDALLKQVSSRLTECLRSSDCVSRFKHIETGMVSRLGGDEFVVLLQEIRNNQDASPVSQRILDDLSRPFQINGSNMVVSASIGISLFPQDGDNAEHLLKNADIAMYNAKEKGKNRYQYYSEEMNKHTFELLHMEYQMRNGLENREFLLHFQPQFNIATREIIGAEALVRWQTRDNGLVSPMKFIPLAEDTGLIIPLGEWVLREACLRIKEIRDSFQLDLTISVNLSSKQFAKDNLLETIKTILDQTRFPPDRLELELTESTIMQDPRKSINTLQQMKAMGISIAIDDFGTGYSSLDHLKRLPVDILKIDRSFVMSIPDNKQDAAITQAIVAMAKNLHLTVIAEGIETEEQLRFLKTLRCETGQGYLYSKPLPEKEFKDFLLRINPI